MRFDLIANFSPGETLPWPRVLEMIRESREREMSAYIVPGVDHFDELNVLADSKSDFFKHSLALINR